jgi:hypothetical protein
VSIVSDLIAVWVHNWDGTALSFTSKACGTSVSNAAVFFLNRVPLVFRPMGMDMSELVYCRGVNR